MLEWHLMLALLAAVSVIAFAIIDLRDKRNAKDDPRDDHDHVTMGKTR